MATQINESLGLSTQGYIPWPLPFVFVDQDNSAPDTVSHVWGSALNGTSPTILVNAAQGTTNPTHVAVDVTERLIFWTGWFDGGGGGSRLSRCDYDGSNFINSFKSKGGVGAVSLPGVATDQFAKKVYWTTPTEIKRSDYDGSNEETIVDTTGLSGRKHALAIHHADNRIYFVRRSGSTTSIYRARFDQLNKDIEFLLTATNITDVEIDPVRPRLYWSRVSSWSVFNPVAGTVYRSFLDLSDGQNLLVSTGGTWGFDIDINGRALYICDDINGDIVKTNLDGTSPSTIINSSGKDWWDCAVAGTPIEGSGFIQEDHRSLPLFLKAPEQISNATDMCLVVFNDISAKSASLDLYLAAPVVITRPLFYVDQDNSFPDNQSHVWSSDLSGSPRSILVPFSSGTLNPTHIAVDRNQGLVFWTGWVNSLGGSSRLSRVNYDGSNFINVFKTATPVLGTALPGVAVDEVNMKVYWSDPTNIKRSNYDGSGEETIITDAGISGYKHGMSLHIVEGKIYFVVRPVSAMTNTPTSIYRADFDALNSNIQLVYTGGIITDVEIDPVEPLMYHSRVNSWNVFNALGGSVWRTCLNGDNEEHLVNTAGTWGFDIHLASGHLYICSDTNGDLIRTDLDGSNQVTIQDSGPDKDYWDCAVAEFAVLGSGAKCTKTGNLNLYLEIDSVPVSGSGLLYVSGPDAISDDVTLFTRGPELFPPTPATVHLQLVTKGPAPIPPTPGGSGTNIALFTKGPEPKTGSLSLVTKGPAPIPPTPGGSGTSITLFTQGPLVPPGPPPLSGSGTPGQFVCVFTKTADFTPQFAGQFFNDIFPAANVTIEVWDLSNGDNTQLLLADDNCYQIGNTLSWAWSSEHLPNEFTNSGNFMYRMTADNGEIYCSRVLLSSVEERGGFPPRRKN